MVSAARSTPCRLLPSFPAFGGASQQRLVERARAVALQVQRHIGISGGAHVAVGYGSLWITDYYCNAVWRVSAKGRVQAKIRTISDAAGAKIRQLSRAEDENAIKVMKEHGLKVEELTPEAEKEWRTLGDTVLSKVRGNTVPADIFDEVEHRLTEFRSGKATVQP